MVILFLLHVLFLFYQVSSLLQIDNMLPRKDLGEPVRSQDPVEDPSVTLFREYLRIKTVHPEPNYGKETISSVVTRAAWSCSAMCSVSVIAEV